MHVHAYILWSASLHRHYVGFSARGQQRLQEHRNGHTDWTSRTNDWQSVWEQAVGTSAEARVLERKIKARGAQRFLVSLRQSHLAPDCESG